MSRRQPEPIRAHTHAQATIDAEHAEQLCSGISVNSVVSLTNHKDHKDHKGSEVIANIAGPLARRDLVEQPCAARSASSALIVVSGALGMLRRNGRHLAWRQS